MQFLASLLLFSFVFLQSSLAQIQLGTSQIIWSLKSNEASINGQPVKLELIPKIIEEKVFLPIKEIARLTKMTIKPVENGFRFGRLEIYPEQNTAKIDGTLKNIEEIGILIDQEFYLSLDIFEQVIDSHVNFDVDNSLIKVAVFQTAETLPNQPIARFTTDKTTYKLGEPVKILNYSFDPQGLAISSKFNNLQEAYFEPGKKLISLVVRNDRGVSSENFNLEINILPEIFATKRDFALRFTPVGRTFEDKDILSYPILQSTVVDDQTPLIVSNSPEKVITAGILYKDTIEGSARICAHHLNFFQNGARFVVFATNLDDSPKKIEISRFGQVVGTELAALLGRVSLLEFLSSKNSAQFSVESNETVPIFISNPMEVAKGLSFLADLSTTGRFEIKLMLLDSLKNWQDLPILTPVKPQVRGTFPFRSRSLEIDLANITNGARLPFADGLIDPGINGIDKITGQNVTLNGNYGLSYRIKLSNVRQTVAAFAPRGGIYSGAIGIDNEILPLPTSGVLSATNQAQIIYRLPEKDELTLEFIPANASFLPVNLIFYKYPPK